MYREKRREKWNRLSETDEGSEEENEYIRRRKKKGSSLITLDYPLNMIERGNQRGK